MIPPKYTLFPSAVLRMREVPIHLRWTYLVLYALAWRHQYEWLDETYQQLAATFTALETGEISPRGIRQRLTDLAGHGLIERRQVGGRYRTYLKIRHEQQGDAPSVTSEMEGDALERHPIKNNVVVGDTGSFDQSVQTPHTYSIRGDVDRTCELLQGMGVWAATARRLAEMEHVTPEYVEEIMEYRAQEAAQGNKLGPGWVVKSVGEGWMPPEEQDEEETYMENLKRFTEWDRERREEWRRRCESS